MNIQEIITKVRLMEIDHTPDGYPAIRMREVSALADALELSESRVRELSRDIVRLLEDRQCLENEIEKLHEYYDGII